MYCMSDGRAFWNMVLNHHSTARTTGIEEWDDLLMELKLSGPRPGIVPSMVSESDIGSEVTTLILISHFFAWLP